jgi:D-serine deaminase-like pyridoxal phosphate-dependent protein
VTEVGLRKEQLDTPFLWVDLQALESNIATMAGDFRAAGVAWRPHTKGIKVPAIAHKAIKAGAIGVTCAKLGEAEVMAAAGITDILIHNQIVTPQKIARLIGLYHHADVKVAVDSEANVLALGQAAHAAGVEIGVVVEVDNGGRRAGVEPGEPAVALSRLAYNTPGVRYLGLAAYEGHARAIQPEEAKVRAIESAVRMLTDSADMCRRAGIPVAIVSAGGSGTYHVTAYMPGVTEIQAGGALFCDLVYQSWGVNTRPALYVRTTVTSRPRPERINFDCGFKSLPTAFGAPRGMGLPAFKSLVMSAEHATAELQEPDSIIHVGDAFDFMVGYADATVFLYDVIYGIRAGVVETVWPILGRGKVR